MHGSSPRLRGTFPCDNDLFPAGRFIPALAGNMVIHPNPYMCRPVHPRACGEHCLISDEIRLMNGSSPRLRGTLWGSGGIRRLYRFIPALAGNILWYWDCSRTGPVHPRACGEHNPSISNLAVAPGSSPRLRGTSVSMAIIILRMRFIPALAGNITNRHYRQYSQAVHPRACGEHLGVCSI